MFLSRERYDDLVYKSKKAEDLENEVLQLRRLLRDIKKSKIEKAFENYNWVVCCDENYNCMIYNNGIWLDKVKGFKAEQENYGYLPELIVKK